MNKPTLDADKRPAITRNTLADAFARRAGAKGAAALDPAQTAFIAQVHQHCAADELAEMTLEDMATLMQDFWAFAARRREGEPLVRLIEAKGADGSPLGMTLLEIVQDDMPFLVDSVMGQLVDSEVTVRAMFHPVVEIVRDGRGRRTAEGSPRRESMMHVLIDPIDDRHAGALLEGVRGTLADLRLAVLDFPDMLALMSRTIAELETAAPRDVDVAEPLAFLRWLETAQFVFLGARVYDYPTAGKTRMAVEASLGVLRDPDRAVLRDASDPALNGAGSGKKNPHAEAPLIVAKANMRSRVHRRTHMDYIGVKRYGPDGRACGEVRFVGLFTSEAYNRPVSETPLIRRKVEHVLDRAAVSVDSHNGRRLRNILDTYPRDELFQIAEDELLNIAQRIMHLYDRPRLRLFTRKDPFDRFASILLFLPRDRYNDAVAEAAGRILADAWGGRVSAVYPSFTDAPLARVHYIIGLEPGDHPAPSSKILEDRVREAARTWTDRFVAAARRTGASPQRADELRLFYAEEFPLGYRDLFGPEEALADIDVLEALSRGGAPVRVRAYRNPEDGPSGLRLKLYRRGQQAALSDVMPIVEKMGLRGLVEHGFAHLRPGDAKPVWIHEIVMDDPAGRALAFDEVRTPFEDAFLAVWSGLTENDGFNRLVLELGVTWREAALVRALARYRQQSGLDPSQSVQEAALSEHPGIARLILDMFRSKFDPGIKADAETRLAQTEAIFGEVVLALQAVDSLDEDRVLRRLALLVRALVRTNYYQLDDQGRPKAHISFKIASRELDDLPAPKPYREIFIWSPQVEGVHLRFGPVARGGLRWSDRRDDFRTEVLGLAKAQQVKNAVIVPVGAKGGFYPKQLTKGGTPDQIRAEGVKAYTAFLHGLLDITDNLDADGKVIPPVGVIRHDGDDPYLVVAADKGTATFSDIANGVAEDFGFWLGDAFASGGSAGYDHKAMGITARGAWEAVKRHFRELGKDIQSEDFTVIGIGDMSGDVFGNGMLLSRHIKLVAAFDHRHVFFDPAPDAEVSFKERERLFSLPRSSWADYDAALISKGGGVFPRSAKSVPLSAEIRALLGVEAESLTPSDLVKAVLKAPAELLYLGGIGTYVKAPAESHADVGDKANDGVRIDGPDLRVRVVGEGANLGVTQAGRIAYAAAGGRIDTDAIDNSAGVDTSDHEVNIKIMTRAAEHKGRLTRQARDRLLRSMTGEVAEHVLAHNYGQTLALSLMQATASADLDSHARFIADLVAAGRLDRRVEGLPGPTAVADLAKAGAGLTRPELAVLLAYGKLELSHDIVATRAPDDPFFEAALQAYFPKGLSRLRAEMNLHRLRREIIATVLANEMVNLAGPTFAPRLRAAANCDTPMLVIAFEAARRIFRVDDLWAQVGALDARVPASVQTDLYLELTAAIRRQVFWLARRRDGEMGVEALIAAYRPAADALRKAGTVLLSPFERAFVEQRVQSLAASGAPQALAEAVAGLLPLVATSDVADMAQACGWPVLAAGRLYHQVGGTFGFDRLRTAAGTMAQGDPFQSRAVRRQIEDLLIGQSAIAASIAGAAKPAAGAEGPTKAIEAWSAGRPDAVRLVHETLGEIEAADGGWSFAKLTIAAGALRELAETAEKQAA